MISIIFFSRRYFAETGQFLLLCSLQLWQQLQRCHQSRARVQVFKMHFTSVLRKQFAANNMFIREANGYKRALALRNAPMHFRSLCGQIDWLLSDLMLVYTTARCLVLWLLCYRENIVSDCFQGCFIVTCTLCTFISLVWLREQILHGGGHDWLDQEPALANHRQVSAVLHNAHACLIIVLATVCWL